MVSKGYTTKGQSGDNSLGNVSRAPTRRNGRKFSSVKRQLKAYFDMAESNGWKVVKSLLIAPEFTDDFINECELEYELNLSLIKASSLYNILEGFKNSNKDQFSYKLLMRDVSINEERAIKAIS